jgi:hypothetical protein
MVLIMGCDLGAQFDLAALLRAGGSGGASARDVEAWRGEGEAVEAKPR